MKRVNMCILLAAVVLFTASGADAFTISFDAADGTGTTLYGSLLISDPAAGAYDVPFLFDADTQMAFTAIANPDGVQSFTMVPPGNAQLFLSSPAGGSMFSLNGTADFVLGGTDYYSAFMSFGWSGTYFMQIVFDKYDEFGNLDGIGDIEYNFVLGNLQSSMAAIPEPATMFLLGAGLAGLAGFRRKKKK